MSKLGRMRKCGINKAVRTLQASEVTYNENEGSSFITGSNLEEMRLRININSSSEFLKGTKMILKIIGCKDNEYNYYEITPISSQLVTLHSSSKGVSFVFKFKHNEVHSILPYGTLYPHATSVDDAIMRVGQVQEYCFTLYAECGKYSHNKHVIPINARYIGSEGKVDYKCERLLVTTAEEENAIPISINGEVIYFTKPHCVSHGQLKKPNLLNYGV